jgi:hypothetical protein
MHSLALADVDRALSLQEDYPRAHFQRAAALFGLHRPDEASVALERVSCTSCAQSARAATCLAKCTI